MSTISIAEYCVLGNVEDLPLKNLQLIPFNVNHAQRTGVFAKIIFDRNKISVEKITPRVIIPNDSKLFAQADLDKSVEFYVTSDARSKTTYKALGSSLRPKFNIIDIADPYDQVFGTLNLW